MKEVIEAKDLTVTTDGQAMIDKARREGVEIVWDRYQAQAKHCNFCEAGLSCRICMMGPCRINPKDPEGKRGVCGADADIMVARNFLRMVAAGAASHSDHGRDLIEVLKAVGEGKAQGYSIKEPEKLRSLAKEYGIDTNGKNDLEIARNLAYLMQEDFGTRQDAIKMAMRAPAQRQEIWKKLGVMPRGIDRETSESLHRTHMGVDNDWVSLLLQGARNALADGWGGSMIGTDLSDVLFGIPTPKQSEVNLGVLKKDEVNIILHGHNPVVSEMIFNASTNPRLLSLAREKGASGINLAGVCCTGNEVLMRKGIPMAGNHLMTELALVTGAVEALIVDYQCVMPSLGKVAQCYHTKMFSTSAKAKFPGAEHVEITPENAVQKAEYLVETAINNFQNRIKDRVMIPDMPIKQLTGFSIEAIVKALGGTVTPLIDVIKAGKIRGAVGVVGCNNPRIKQDSAHRVVVRKLIANDILVVDTGCVAVATAKDGLKMPESAQLAGPGLKEVCTALSIPPVLHMGSCVDNSRIMVLAAALANYLGTDISSLPIAASAPEWYSEKAVTIALYAVASGVTTFLGPVPPITGSKNIVEMALNGLENVFGARFVVEPDPDKAAALIINHIESKRAKLGLDSRASI